MEHAWYIYLLVLVGGAFAGVINTLAGSGSLVTLPLLIFLGLPATVANGTNRVGVIVQCFVGLETLRRGGKLRTEGSLWFIGMTVAGALAGAFIASQMSPENMELAIAVVMALMLVVILINPKRWLRETSELSRERPPWWLLAVFFAVGVYGGFIQAGVGILLLAALVLGAGYEIVEATAVKLLIAAIFTTGALVVFVLNDQVHWGYGALMAVGQSTGAWVAARFAVESENAAVWVRRMLVAIVFFSMLELLGVLSWVMDAISSAM
ncbi:MAG: sulfite exporter TauE/SafE family protein [Persicimonas sp.]